MNRKMIIIIFAAAIIAILFFGIRSIILDSSLKTANLSIDDLNNQINSLNVQLNNENSSLAQKESQLQNMTEDLNAVKILNEEYSQQLVDCEEDYTNNIALLEKQAEQNRFYFYYVKSPQVYNLTTLKSFLTIWNWDSEYEKGNLDYNQMTALLEKRLEDNGYHTLFCYGNIPDIQGEHFWLMVETLQDKYTPVEALSPNPAVVSIADPDYNYYMRYTGYFETIEEVMDYAPGGFVWWDN